MLKRALSLWIMLVLALPPAELSAVPHQGLVPSPVIVPYGQYRGRLLSHLPPNKLLEISNRKVFAAKGLLQLRDTAVEGLCEVLHGADHFKQGAGETSPCSGGQWWKELRDFFGRGQVDTACKRVYEQLGTFCSDLSSSSWWSIWRYHRHPDLVESARQMIDNQRLCRACGLPLLTGNEARGENTHSSDNEDHVNIGQNNAQLFGQILAPEMIHAECLLRLCPASFAGSGQVAMAA